MNAVAKFLYRMNIEGDEEVKAKIQAIGTAEEESVARAIAAANRKAAALAKDEARIAVARKESQDADQKAQAMLTGGLLQYEAAKRRELVAEQAVNRERARTTVSVGQLRAGTQQLSYQIGDVAQQFALGTPPMTIFAQQGGQVIQAMQLMSGSSKGLIGFLGGPWGAAIMGGATILATLTAGLLDNAEASKAAEAGNDGLSDAQGALGRMFDLTSGKLKEQNSLLRLNALLTAQKLRAEGRAEEASARSVFGQAGTPTTVGSLSALLNRSFYGGGQFASEALRRNAADQRALLNAIEKATTQAARDAAYAAAMKYAERGANAFAGQPYTVDQFVQALINRESGPSKIKTADDIERSLSENRLDPGFIRAGGGGSRRRSGVDRQGATDAAEFARAIEALESRFDKAGAAMRRFEEQRATIARALKEKKITPDQAALYNAGNQREFNESQLGWQVMEAATKGYAAAEKQRVDRLNQILDGQRDSLAITQAELGLVGKTDSVRQLELDKLRMMQQLGEALTDAEKAKHAEILANLEAQSALEEQLRKNAEYTQLTREIGGRIIEDVLNPKNWDNWGDAAKRVLESILQDMIMLAAINPLKNQLFGTDLPTMGGLFGNLFGGGGGGFNFFGLFKGGSSSSIVAGEHEMQFGRNPFAWAGIGQSIGLPGFATGTEYFGGGAAMVGERGPEMALFPRGTKIVPASATAKAMQAAAPVSLSIQTTIDARGAQPGAEAALRQVLAERDARLPGEIVRIVADAQQRLRGPLGLNR